MGRRGPVPPPTRSPYATLVALTRREPHGSFFSVGFDTQGGGGAVITATELATEEAAHLPLALNTVIYRGLSAGLFRSVAVGRARRTERSRLCARSARPWATRATP